MEGNSAENINIDKKEGGNVINLANWLKNKAKKIASFGNKYIVGVNKENNKDEKEKVNHHSVPSNILSEEQLKENKTNLSKDDIEKMRQEELANYGYNSVSDLERIAKEENIPFKLRSWEIGTPEGKQKIDSLLNQIKNRINSKYDSSAEKEEAENTEETNERNVVEEDASDNFEEMSDTVDEKVEEAMDDNPEMEEIKKRSPDAIKKTKAFFRKLDLALGRMDKKAGKYFREKKAKKDKEDRERKTKKEETKKEKREKFGNKTKENSKNGSTQKGSGEDFNGREYFDKDFQGKDNRNIFTKANEKRKLNKERKDINKLYESGVKKIDDKFFYELLGEERVNELKNLSGEEKRLREKEMIDEIVANTKYSLDKEEILDKLKSRNEAEEEVYNRRGKIKGPLQEIRDRKRFKGYLEKDIKYYENKIKELKERKLPGDKEHIKKIKDKLKALGKIETEKDSPAIKFRKERLKKRKENLKSKESQEKLKKIKNEFTENLKRSGKGTLAGIWGATFGAVIQSARAGIILGSVSAALNVLVKEMGTNFIKTLKNLLLFLAELGIATGETGKRYLVGK